MGNTDPNNINQENKYEVKPQYEELSKQLIMQHAIINAMKCMRAIKNRIARPVYQLAIISSQPHTRSVYHREPVIPSQLGGRHSNPVVTTPMMALNFSGTTYQSSSHNVAFDHVINQSIRLNMYAYLTRHGNPQTFTHWSRQISCEPPGSSDLLKHLAYQLKQNFKIEENTYPKAYTNQGTLGQDFNESVERTGYSRFLKSTVLTSKLVSIGRATQKGFSATKIIHNKGWRRRKSTERGYGEQ
ncbi:hypothetical protein F511_27802 [Dorcoceras hygrometricum]|uniref:Uncharacterized protein n=1 Tax=Dorcoceras hygrometricum TaxID=472368 RepID=A0A2Z7CT26_9LAMI|nr:hypothetical protein F511_27802 [Dorcoceras hygrometricum]